VTGAPLVPAPVYGLRTWVVTEGERLAGPHGREPWPAGPVTAACRLGSDHAAPAPGCTCGLHAWHPRPASARRVLGVRGEVPGILEAWGPVEVHERGFRAAHGRIGALVLTPGRNAALLTRLAAAYHVELLALDGPDALLAHCRAHGLGLDEPVVAAILGPERIARERHVRRQRARRRAAVFAGLALAVGGIALAAHPQPEPSGKVLYGRAGQVVVP
jgi:hypothetical protein